MKCSSEFKCVKARFIMPFRKGFSPDSITITIKLESCEDVVFILEYENELVN